MGSSRHASMLRYDADSVADTEWNGTICLLLEAPLLLPFSRSTRPQGQNAMLLTRFGHLPANGLLWPDDVSAATERSLVFG